MKVYSLIEWCNTDIASIHTFHTRKALLDFLGQKADPEIMVELRTGNYYTNECGFALEIVQGTFHN